MKRMFGLIAAVAAMICSPAMAAKTITIDGTFTGNLLGSPFGSTDAVFTATTTSDTPTTISGAKVYDLSSLTAVANGVTYTFTDTGLKFGSYGTYNAIGTGMTNILFSFGSTGTGIAGLTNSAFNVSSSNGIGPVTIGSVANASVSIAAAVPEPASWALMIIGVGAVGFAMRRKVAPRVTFATA